jgi:hypothetical protein
MRYSWSAAVLVATLLPFAPAAAQEPDSARIEDLEEQIEAITRELEELKLGREVVAQADTAMYGLGPAASKVYRVRRGVSIGGYGEFLYENFRTTREDGTPSGKTDQLDALRGVVYVGYKFSDRILFNSEIEVEHSATAQAGSVSLEFAYLDYRLTDPVGARAGLLLLPMGLVNEQHEPTTFLPTERSETERRILPTTWREVGIGVFGAVGGFGYRAYVVSGLDAVGGGSSKASGFDASGVRGGRQKGSKAVAQDFAGVARLDYTGTLGVMIGGSAYLGQSGQDTPAVSDPGSTIDALTFIWEAHAQYRAHGFDVRGLFSMAFVDDVDLLNEAKGLTGAASIGERMVGWYVEGGYDVLRSARTRHQLTPFVRYEQIDTQSRVPAGFAANPATDEDIATFGAAWKPIPNLVVKGDYQVRRNAADTGVNQWNLAIGYVF